MTTKYFYVAFFNNETNLYDRYTVDMKLDEAEKLSESLIKNHPESAWVILEAPGV